MTGGDKIHFIRKLDMAQVVCGIYLIRIEY